MLPLAAAALPLAGSIFGGIQGYQQSGGDIGAAALGAGLGAAGGYYLPAGVRMAGQALMGLPMVGSAVSAASPKAFQALQGLKAVQAGKGLGAAAEAAKAAGSYATHPLATQLGKGAIAKGLTGAAVLGGSMALPGIAGGAANLLSAPVRAATGGLGQVGQLGLGVTGRSSYNPSYQNLGAAYGQTDEFGNIRPYGSNLTDIYGIPGMARSAETIRQAEAQAEAQKRLGDVQFQQLEAAEKQNFARQMAAAGIKQNILTQAAMIQGAQNAAREVGFETARGISQGMANRMQYQ